MSELRVALLCAFPALSTVLLASDGKDSAASGGPSTSSRASEPGVPALFAWGDFDGDRRLDIAAVSGAGKLQLLSCAGEGRFEDVTERTGLAGIEDAALALWADYDGDGRLDLFVGARAGASRLFRNEGMAFVEMSAASGLASEGAVQSAHWFDHDGDGRLDLFVVTAEESTLFRGLEGGFFELAELPPLAGLVIPGLGGIPAGALGFDEDRDQPGPSGRAGSSVSTGTRAGGSIGIAVSSGGGARSGGSTTPLLPPPPMSCMDAIKDQASLPSCIQASTTPALGRLYPLTSNLFVAVGGNVGIGTTSPSARLHVAGTARMTGTLTLAPGTDTALDVSTGSIYKGGALFIHTKGGSGNTALGRQALTSVTSGFSNTASGYRALFSDTTGYDNTASGHQALYSNTSGFYNTACGRSALFSNTTGYRNTASGTSALISNTIGESNTASGVVALANNTTGTLNAAFGDSSLFSNTTGSRNTAVGTLALAFNTTANSNTAIGVVALQNNTTGTGNTASGDSALYFNTTGYMNTATGQAALYSNTTGHHNAAHGNRALQNNTVGNSNTASGAEALLSNTLGYYNTASGSRALFSNTFGGFNTANGYRTLYANTEGRYNTACGSSALGSTTTGLYNTASGHRSLFSNTTGGNNTAVGYRSLYSNTTGVNNTALGDSSGSNLTTGSDNIAIGNNGVAGDANRIRIGTAGTHTRTFIAGIRGVTTGVANGITVLIDSAGQLGTVSSSKRFKEEIRDMGELTDRLLELRPVVFRYKPEVQEGERPLEYGLIAEEVAEVFPDLVVHDEQGQPFTVKYHLLSAMLLNELKVMKAAHEHRLEELEDANTALEGRLGRLESVEAEVASLTASLAALLETR